MKIILEINIPDAHLLKGEKIFVKANRIQSLVKEEKQCAVCNEWFEKATGHRTIHCSTKCKNISAMRKYRAKKQATNEQ